MLNSKCNADCQVDAKMFRFFHASKLCWKVNFFVSFSLSVGKDYTLQACHAMMYGLTDR